MTKNPRIASIVRGEEAEQTDAWEREEAAEPVEAAEKDGDMWTMEETLQVRGHLGHALFATTY